MYPVTPVQSADLQELKRIELACGLSPWTIAGYESEYDRPDSVMLKAQGKTSGHQIVGFLVGRVPLRGGEAEILNLGVVLELRRQGIASILLKQFGAICTDRQISAIWLEVRAANHAAIGLYRSHGFFQKGTRPRFYSDPEDDAVLMFASAIRPLRPNL